MDRSPQVKAFQSLGARRTTAGRAWALCLALVLGACTGGLSGQPADPVAALGPTAEIAFTVVDAETGAVLAARTPGRPMIPASTAKVATMIAALELLGPDFRFNTRVLATGIPDRDGVLTGDLILKGGGDPLLTPQDLFGLAQRLRDLGLKRVAGRFLFDQSQLPALPAINPDQPLEAGYNSGVSALSLDFNRWRLLWRPGQEESDPPGPALTRLPPLQTHDAKLDTGPHGPGRPVLWRDGSWRLGTDAALEGDRFLPVRSPGLAAAQLFRRFAEQAGVDLPPPQAGAAPDGAAEVTRLVSLPLSEIARLGLEHSNNLVAELIGLEASRLYLIRPDNLLTSAAVMSAWLQRVVAASGDRTAWDGWLLPNHSGLSRKARVTPAQMAAVLRYAHGRRYGGWPFASFLPTAGFRKAFRDRFLTEVAAGRIWAKTGTMHYAKGLAGYLMGKDGRTRIFALYIADPEKRGAYDALDAAARDAPWQQENARSWIDAAERAEQAIVLDWLARF